MKRLISQYRKSPFTKRHTSFKKHAPFLISMATVVTVVSCRLHHQADSQTSGASLADDLTYNPFQSLVPKLETPIESRTFIKLTRTKDQQVQVIASVLPPDCKTLAQG